MKRDNSRVIGRERDKHIVNEIERRKEKVEEETLKESDRKEKMRGREI